MYQVFLGYVQLPVAPSKITTSINSRNKTIELIDGSEVSILKDKGLTEINFDFMLPYQSYPFVLPLSASSNTQSDMTNQDRNGAILEYLEFLKTSKRPFQLIISREGEKSLQPSGFKPISNYNTSVTVSMENYTINEDANNGMDFIVSINLKQFKTYTTVTVDGEGRVTKTRPKTSVSGDWKSDAGMYSI